MTQDSGRPNQNPPSEPAARRKYTWPRYVLGAVIVFVLLSIWWMSRLIREIRYRKQLMHPQTNVTLRVEQARTPPATTNANSMDSENDVQP